MDLLLSFGGFDLKVAQAFASTVRRLVNDVFVPRNREYLHYRRLGRMPIELRPGIVQVVRVAPLKHLYRTGVIYAEDPPGAVSLADVPTVIARGWGHCAHLSAWLCADLQNEGYDAAIRLKWAPRLRQPGRLYHVQVRLHPKHGFGPPGLGQIPDDSNHLGQILDPSRMLGMGTEPRLVGDLTAGAYPAEEQNLGAFQGLDQFPWIQEFAA